MDNLSSQNSTGCLQLSTQFHIIESFIILVKTEYLLQSTWWNKSLVLRLLLYYRMSVLYKLILWTYHATGHSSCFCLLLSKLGSAQICNFEDLEYFYLSSHNTEVFQVILMLTSHDLTKKFVQPCLFNVAHVFYFQQNNN